MSNNLDFLVLGGGCFWCTEAIFSRVRGVEKVTAGYAGGHTENPDYYSVVSGRTGHAEVIKVEFNPKREHSEVSASQVTLNDLLEIFFATHDPTTLNRQGADHGTQYRSILLANSPEQLEAIQRYVAQLAASADAPAAPIVTEVKLLEAFYPAEISHQEYYELQTEAPYCQIVIAPKIAKFLQKFKDKAK